MSNHEYIVTLSCADRRGIVQRVSEFLAKNDANIVDLAQFSDIRTGCFFMRVHFVIERCDIDLPVMQERFGVMASRLAMVWRWYRVGQRLRLLLLASREGHCLNDLLFRWQSGALRADIVGVVSNHDDLAAMVSGYRLPFHHLPLATGTSDADRSLQERKIRAIIDGGVDLVVLARYMQILSAELCELLRGRAINIHHSFLPGFKGGRPYHQAHERGVKLIGATAHFVTPDLDEGPIIEQDVVRVDHAMDPDALSAIGKDVENIVLARAVKYFIEHRIFLNGQKTVIFR